MEDNQQKNRRILLCKPRVSGREMKYIEEAFSEDWIVPLGPNVDGFERDLRDFLHCGEKEVVALSAGTAAVHLALVACGVGAGDEVMVQSFTFSASANPVTYVGGTPVFVDSEPESWNMDPELLDHAIADRIAKTGKKPKAIIPVYLYGMPGDVDRILAVGEKYDIPVIEDAAEAFGSSYKGRKCGTMGRFGVLSFNGNKMITTSGGGALVCPDSESRRDIMNLATQAREAYPYYEHTRIGYNYRMSNICAGIGRGQMEIVEEHLNHHKKIQRLYEELFGGTDCVSVHKNPTSDYDSNFWLSTITFPRDMRLAGEERAYQSRMEKAVGGAAGVLTGGGKRSSHEPLAAIEGMRLRLAECGIETRPLWKPMHRQPVYASNPAYINGVSDDLFSRGLCLPTGPCVSEEDAAYVVFKIKECLERGVGKD